MGVPPVSRNTYSLRAGLSMTPIFIALLSLAVGGCATGRQPGVVRIPIEDQSARVVEARRLALAAQNAKDTDEAIALYRRSVEAYRDLAPAWNNLGVLLMERQQYLDAAEAFTTASEIQPTDARPLYNLGLTWEKAGYLRDALRHYIAALGRDPRYQPALRGAVRAEQLLGDVSEDTLHRLRAALGQEQDERWRAWFELQRPQVEQEVYAAPMRVREPER